MNLDQIKVNIIAELLNAVIDRAASLTVENEQLKTELTALKTPVTLPSSPSSS